MTQIEFMPIKIDAISPLALKPANGQASKRGDP
jgi:hypothetical protein